MSPKVSVVVPVFNSAQTLDALLGRLESCLKDGWTPFELIFVDDGSSDHSWQVLSRLAKMNSNVKAVRLSRNFGQHYAVLAGVQRATGDITAIMDCDLQDQPEDMTKILTRLAEGFDIVVTQTVSHHQSLIRRILRRIYFHLVSWSSGIRLEQNLGTMVAFNQKVREGFLAIRERNRHTNLLLAWLGYKRASVTVQKLPSTTRKSSYSLRKLFVQAVTGTMSSSTRILTLAVFLGSFIVAGSVLVALFVIRNGIALGAQNGWVSLMLVLLMLGGMILVFLGVIGFYVGKLFEQLRERPLFLIDVEIGMPD